MVADRVIEYDADLSTLRRCDKHGPWLGQRSLDCPRCPPPYAFTPEYFMVAKPCALPLGTIIDQVDVHKAAGEVARCLIPCRGQDLGMETFGELYKVIGHAYGGSMATLTFKLPDLRGRAVAAVKTGDRIQRL